MINRINDAHHRTSIPPNNNRPSIRKRINTFFPNLGRLFTLSPQPLTSTRRVLQIHPENNLKSALDYWTKVVLDQWETEGDPQERRAQAKSTIKAFLSNPNSHRLSLYNLKLSTLPDIWEHPAFIQRLKILEFTNNQLQTLPNSIAQLTSLQILSFSNNQISVIPEFLTQLTSLKVLSFSKNQISVIPEFLAQLTALQILDFSNNQLSIIPEFLEWLTALHSLDLSHNQISVLPGFLARLTDLTNLDLCSNRFLTDIPVEFLQLPSSCSIHIRDCCLSRQSLLRLEEINRSIRYRGPTIHYTRRNLAPQTVHELLDSFYQIAGKPKISFPDEFTTHPQLRNWLARISWMADFNANQTANRSQIVNRVLHFIELAADPKHREFHDAFFGIIHDAAETCGDRMSLSILHLGIAHNLALLDAMETPPIKELANTLLRGTWALSLLEKIAKEKIECILTTRPGFEEEIEVYLGYPIRLKEGLKLPIDINDMLYFRCSALTEEDLNEAEKSVLQHLNNKEEACAFLASQKIWIKALHKLGLLQELNQEKEKKTGEAKTNEDDVAIDDAYKQGLREISAQILSECLD